MNKLFIIALLTLTGMSNAMAQQEVALEEKVYEVVEEMPSFPGGQGAMFEFIANNIQYPIVAEENGVQVRTVEYIVRNFASELPEIPTMRKKKKDASEEDYDKLRAEVTRLRKELRQEKMRAEALDTMIDVAEEMFNIPVRKKAGTKQ